MAQSFMKFVKISCVALILFMSFITTGCSNQDPLLLLTLSQQALAEQKIEGPLPPHEFISDGCSLWQDGDWLQCCVTHDLIYWAGGTRKERKTADQEMQKCVSNTGHPVMGKIMYLGVRIGGVYWLPTPYRWGFGWDYPQPGPPGKEY